MPVVGLVLVARGFVLLGAICGVGGGVALRSAGLDVVHALSWVLYGAVEDFVGPLLLFLARLTHSML